MTKQSGIEIPALDLNSPACKAAKVGTANGTAKISAKRSTDKTLHTSTYVYPVVKDRAQALAVSGGKDETLWAMITAYLRNRARADAMADLVVEFGDKTQKDSLRAACDLEKIPGMHVHALAVVREKFGVTDENAAVMIAEFQAKRDKLAADGAAKREAAKASPVK